MLGKAVLLHMALRVVKIIIIISQNFHGECQLGFVSYVHCGAVWLYLRVKYE